jgi:probable F420-dependent oxidoreductase
MDVDDRVEFQNAAAVRAMAQAIEQAGIDACYLTDHPAPTQAWRVAGHDALDPFTGLMSVAAATSQLRLHTNLVVLPYRNPFLTAKSAATLDVLSDGRLILGVGVGYLRGEYEALGADFDGRGAAMDEALETMKAAWSGTPVGREGRRFVARDIVPRPLPAQQPHPPIWHGGNSDRAIRRAAALCDGWSPIFAGETMSKRAGTDEIASLDDLKVKLDKLRTHLSDNNRSGPFDMCIGPQRPLQACTRPEAERFVEQLSALAELGATWSLCTVPHPTRQAYLDNLQWFAEEIVPKAHALVARPLH